MVAKLQAQNDKLVAAPATIAAATAAHEDAITKMRAENADLTRQVQTLEQTSAAAAAVASEKDVHTTHLLEEAQAKPDSLTEDLAAKQAELDAAKGGEKNQAQQRRDLEKEIPQESRRAENQAQLRRKVYVLVSTSEWVTEDAQPPCCGWQALGDELDPLKETLKTAEGNQDAAGVADARQKIHEVNTKHGLHNVLV